MPERTQDSVKLLVNGNCTPARKAGERGFAMGTRHKNNQGARAYNGSFQQQGTPQLKLGKTTAFSVLRSALTHL